MGSAYSIAGNVLTRKSVDTLNANPWLVRDVPAGVCDGRLYFVLIVDDDAVADVRVCQVRITPIAPPNVYTGSSGYGGGGYGNGGGGGSRRRQQHELHELGLRIDTLERQLRMANRQGRDDPVVRHRRRRSSRSSADHRPVSFERVSAIEPMVKITSF